MNAPNNNLTNKITQLLEDYPLLRDDWQYTLAVVWRHQIGEQNHSVSCFAMLGKIAKKELAGPESVRRTWQKILEKRADLRGPGYNKRHTEEEPQYKELVKKMKIPPSQGSLF